jgi:hypothetical protein
MLASTYLAQLPTSTAQYPKLLNGLLTLSEHARQSHLRNLCLIDLYFLLRYPLGRRDIEHPWLFARCREVQGSPNGHLDLWFREGRKSSIITFGLTIQDILNDPEITVGIFSHTRPNAKAFLRQIKREFETNTSLKAWFPDILWREPHKEAPKWSEDEGIVVRRKSNPKEATVEGWGLVDGMPTGRHFKLRVYDDVVTRESVTTPEQVRKTTEAWELSDNLGAQGGWVRYIGTRYSLHDTYATMMERNVVSPRVYPATDNGRLDGTPVLFSPDEWEKKKDAQRSQIAAQMLQNPLAAADAVFDARWLKPYEIRPKTLNVYIMCDPSKGRSATSDNTAIAVVGVSSSGVRYIIDGFCHRMSLSQRWTALRDLYRKWSTMDGVMHVGVGYERYGAQSDDEYFQERQRIEKIAFAIDELNWVRDASGGQSKRDRVERLEPDFRNGRFLLPISVWREGKPSVWRVARTCLDCQVPNDISAAVCKACGTERLGEPAVAWREVESLTRLQAQTLEGGGGDLIAKAIKRVDAENRVYDLTARFIEEFLQFPFGHHDDLVDAASRLYDLEPVAPVVLHKGDTEPPIFFDS